jgi:exonuclease VII large subunit
MASKYIPISQATSEYEVKVIEANNDLLQNKSQALARANEKRHSNPTDPRYEDDMNRLSLALDTFSHNLRELYEIHNTEVAKLHQRIVTRHEDMKNDIQLEVYRIFQKPSTCSEELFKPELCPH